MTSEIDPLNTVPFLSLACQKALLTPEVAKELEAEAKSRGIPVEELVREKGLLESDDVKTIEAEATLQQTLPGYEIMEVIGEGGMGVVYKAKQLNLDRIAAVKTIHLKDESTADLSARFQLEAKSVAKLRHPNIVTAYDFGQHEGHLFLVMELLEGETLDVLIEREGRQTEIVTWLLLRQVLAGLIHAQKNGLVHRDIKPSNLFLVEAPEGVCMLTGKLVKITDFGLAFQPDGKKLERLTQTGTPLGTPLYMAPEQLTNSTVDHRADMYALGATAFHMLGGKPPFSGKTFYELAAIKIQGELPDLDSLSGFVSSDSLGLLRSLLAHEVSDRPDSYEELIGRIDNLPSIRDQFTSQTLPAIAAPPTPSPSTKPANGKRLLVPIAVLVLAVSGLFGAYLLWDRGETPAGPTPEPKPTMVASGWSEYLFDGQSVSPPAWIPLAGKWIATSDSEGGKILAGDGVARRRLPPIRNFRLAMGLDLFRAEAVEIHFGLPDDESPYPVLRVTAAKLEMGMYSPDDETFESKHTRKTPTKRRGASPYQEVRLERQGEFWWAYFDGKKIGYLPAKPTREANEFRLEVTGGLAHFEGIQIRQLVRPKS